MRISPATLCILISNSDEMIIKEMADTVGFEPTIEFSPYTPLAGERLQPLGHVSTFIAEEILDYQKIAIRSITDMIFVPFFM